MRAALLLAIVGLASLAAGNAHAQGHPIGAAGDVITIPADFRGAGFAPGATSAQLDSNEWLAYGGSAATTFGGTCTTGACARGPFTVLTGILPGVYAVDPIAVLGSTPGVGLQSGLAGGTFRPGGLRFRFHNIEAFPLRTAVVTVRWASNIGGRLDVLPNEIRARFLPGCDPSAAIPLLMGTRGTRDTGAWQVFTDTYDPFDMNVPMMTDACIELQVGSSPTLMTLGLSALFGLEIELLPAVCGDGLIEIGEDCERAAGGPTITCGCNDACLFPSGTPCDVGVGPCVGACERGSCHGVMRTDTFSVPGCDNDAFCDGLERCIAGTCSTISTVACGGVGVCAECDEALDACVAIAGCCTFDEDCFGACDTGVCTENVCETDPACTIDAAVVPDGGSPPDGSVANDDGSVANDDATRPDGANAGVDGGAGAQDAGSAFDGGPERIASGFGGGGGCRCAAAGSGRSGGSAIGLGLLVALVLQRRLRRTRPTPHASA